MIKNTNKAYFLIILIANTLISCGQEASKTQNSEGLDFFTAILIIIGIIGLVVLNFVFFKYIFPVGLWFRALIAGVRVSPKSFFNMYIQKVPADVIVENLIKAKKANLEIPIKKLIDYYLATIEIPILVEKMIKCKNANVNLTIDQLAKIILAKQDVDNFIDAFIMIEAADIKTNFDELYNYLLTGANIKRIVKNKIETKNAGFPVEFKDIVAHELAGGNVEKTVSAYIAAKKANLPDVEFNDVAEIDLAGYDVVEIVQNAIIPRVVEGDIVRAIARDGVEVTMKLKVTLRARLKYIVGNPDENTILARINESLATEIGLSESHLKVLESPFELAEKVEKKHLDQGTAFEVLSIDVSDLSIGRDFHAILVTDRAKAEAEKANVEILKAEEKLKKAIAAAFLDGKITVEEYERLLNLQADTKMRNSFAQQFSDKENEEGEESQEHKDEHKNNHDEKH